MDGISNAQAWAAVDKAMGLRAKLAEGEIVPVSAKYLKKVGKREPRLMAKFDTRMSRPAVIRHATILSPKKGEYLIVPFDGYQTLNPAGEITNWEPPSVGTPSTTLPWSGFPRSESQAIDMAHACELLHDFLGEKELVLTIRGRRYTPEFSFRVDGIAKLITVDRAQIEVDAGYEAKSRIYLVESKLGKADEFPIRQLYYPCRMWEQLTRKEVVPVYLGYTVGVFQLRQYRISSSGVFGIEEIKAADYVIGSSPSIRLADILDSTKEVAAPIGVPFPQADDLNRVIDVACLVAARVVVDSDEVAVHFGFDQRQALFYLGAAKFLDLVKGRGEYKATIDGALLLTTAYSDTSKLIILRLAGLPVLRDALQHYSDKSFHADQAVVEQWVTALEPALAANTVARRAQTVLAWAKWVAGRC